MAESDKREFDREPVEAEALVVEMREAGGRSFAGRTRNLSPGGAYVEAHADVAVGTELQLFIGSLRSTAALRVVGTVAHAHPGVGFGVSFSDADEESREYVADFIRRFCTSDAK